MAERFSQEAEDDELPEKRASQQRLLLLLLLLILLFGYLYFFTDLIRPRPEAPKPLPAAQSQIVKKPLPLRVAQNEETPEEKPSAAKGGKGATGAPEQKPEAAGRAKEGAKPATAAKPAAATPSAKPAKNGAPARAGKYEPPAQEAETKPTKPAAKPAPKEAKPVIEKKPAAKGVAQPKGAEKPGAANKTAAAGKKAAGETTPPAAGKKGAAEKTASAAKEGAAGKTAAAAKKGAAANGGAESAAKGATKQAAGRYAVEIDRDLAESEMTPVMTKVKRAGMSRIVKSKAQKGEQVHRLFLADFANHEEAQEELERLKLAAPGAFMLKENGRYAVYAGSYLREGKAAAEQDRLYEKGVKLLLKSAKAPVPVVRLRAGSFPDQASAERSASRLKKEGVPAKVVRLGK
jgi:hypothetical protein